MPVNLTEKQYLMLSQFSYLDFTSETDLYDPDKGYQGQTLGQVAERLLQQLGSDGQPRVFEAHGGLNDSDFRSLLESIAYGDPIPHPSDGEPGLYPVEYSGNNSELRNLVLTGFENNNSSKGFVAYAFKDSGSEDTVFAFHPKTMKFGEQYDSFV